MRSIKLTICLAYALWTTGLVCAETWIDRCAEPQNAWQLGANQPNVRILQHNRRHGSDRQADAEVLRFSCPPGVASWWWRPTPPAAVIDELAIELSVGYAQSPVGIAAEVVLPRSRDPETGRPRRVVVRPSESNAWRQGYPARGVRMRLEDLPTAVERAIRMRRLGDPRTDLDSRGAYVAGVGLIASGGPTPISIEINQLSLEGRIAPVSSPSGKAKESTPENLTEANDSNSNTLGGELKPTTVELTSTGWRIDGKEFFVRARRPRGESPEQLVSLGFNAVMLDAAPSANEVAQYGEVGLRVLCPCPGDGSEVRETSGAILAWILPGRKTADGLDAGLAEIDRLRSLPRGLQRPVIVTTIDGHDAWSRAADGLVIETPGGGIGSTSQSSALQNVVSQVAPGTPFIATVPLDVSASTQNQIDALLGDGVASAWLPPYRVFEAIDEALATSVCGVAFTSTGGLNSPEAAAEIIGEAASIENERLRMIEPWLTAQRQASAYGDDAVFLVRNGARLTLGATTSATSTRGGRRHLLTPAGIRPEASFPVAASDRIDLVESGDPRIVQSLTRYLAGRSRSNDRRMAKLARLCVAESKGLTQSSRRTAERLLNESELARARNDLFAAFLLSRRATQLVQNAEKQRLRIAQTPAGVRESSPLALMPNTLTEHFRLTQLLAAAPRGPNRLQGGSFEDVGELQRFGWNNQSDGESDVSVELVAGSPIHGERRLRLSGATQTKISTPPIPISAGEVVEVTGWAKIESEKGSGKLQVSDTLGGEELALTIEPTDDYQLFRIIRSVTSSTTFRVHLKAQGDAFVDIDGVMVRPATLPSSVATRDAVQAK